METNELVYYQNFRDALLVNNLRYQLYFDASDILACVKGISDFLGNDRGVRSFYESRTLVHTLLCAGLLNEIYLLPSHQNELSRKLEGELNSNFENNNINKLLPDLLEEVLSDNRDKHVELGIQMQQGESALKVVTLMFPAYWRSRLYWLVQEKNILKITKYTNQDISIQNTELVLKIYNLLEKKRPSKTINNRIDAVALEYFALQVEKYQSAILSDVQNQTCPVMFDPEGWFTSLLEEDISLKKYFILNLKSGQSIFLLRRDEFFFCLSLFNANVNEPDSFNTIDLRSLQNHELEVEKFKDYLRDKASRIDSLLKKDQQSIDSQQKVNQELEKYVKNDFFLKIVLSCFTRPENRKTVEMIRNSKNINMSLLFSDDMNKRDQISEWINHEYIPQFDRLTQAIVTFDNKYGFLFVMATRLKLLRKLLQHFNKESDGYELFHQVSLTRFFIPYTAQQHIKDEFLSLHSFFTLEDDQFIIKLYNRFKELKDKRGEENTENLYSLLSLLWLTRSYNFAYEIYNLNHQYSPSLLMLFGAIFSRDDKSVDIGFTLDQTRINRTMVVIERIIYCMKDAITYGNIETEIFCKAAVSFLHFQIIQFTEAQYYSNIAFDGSQKRLSERELICLKYTKLAVDLMNDELNIDKNLRLYVTNIHIYYIVELGTDDHLFSIKDVVQSFAQLDKIYPAYWHYRYEDTLARYYYRLSRQMELTADTKSIKFELASISQNRMRKAFKMAGTEVDDFRDLNDMKLFREQLAVYVSSVVSTAQKLN